jgi:hypothetical protein
MMISNIYTTTLLILFSFTSTLVCIQTTKTFPLQCPMVLRFEVLTVVMLKTQVCWDILLIELSLCPRQFEYSFYLLTGYLRTPDIE